MIPDYMQQYENSLKNFSLHFDYFSQWTNENEMVERHAQAAAAILPSAGAVLRGVHARQKKILENIRSHGGFCHELTAKLITPFVTGLGGNHPTETGMLLDRNTGLPYIPASGIKGVLRLCHALNLAENQPELVKEVREGFEIPDTEPSMRKYFGDTDTGVKNAVRGQIVFLDAFPKAAPRIRMDIMTPHFSEYYKGNLPPKETENPVPVPFMVVTEGVEFVFRLFALPLAEGATVSRTFDDEDRKAVQAMFRRACGDIGFGAKTSVGYGRFAMFETQAGSEQEACPSSNIVWPKANLKWSPGNAVLTASFEGKKAEIKLSGDRSIVPEPLRKKLFEKKAAVSAQVTLEKDGNLLTIVGIQMI